MRTRQFKQRWKDYGLALTSVALAALVRAVLPGPLAETPFLAFYPAVAIAAMRGFGPGLLATITSAVCYGLWFTTDPTGFHAGDATEWLRLSIFLAGGAGVSLIGHRQRAAQAGERQRGDELLASEAEKHRQKDLLAVTLASIGDGVIVTDLQGRVTFQNAEAERLTGWNSAEAEGEALATVFKIINDETRATVESPADKVLRLGTVVGLANHTILVARDGRETPIDDSGAPIRSDDGAIRGVVLVFRDFSAQKKAEQALRDSEQQVRRRLESILAPEGDLGSLELGDLIDGPAIQSLMESFYGLVPIPMALIDLKGKVLVGVGWQDICTRFHRINAETCQHCIESDVELTLPIAPGECKLYKCKNHMWDMATPITVGGQRVGNLFTGQFFLADEVVPREFFRSRAKRYGFDEAEYLAAVDAAPRLSRETVNSGMAFLMKLAQMVSLLSYSNVKLARALAENQRQQGTLAVQLAVLQSAANAIVITAPDGTMQWVNAAFTDLTGYGAAEAIGQNLRLLKSGHHDRAFYQPLWDTVLAGKVWQGELVNRRKDGSLYTEEMTITPVADVTGKLTHLVSIKQDVSERKKREKELLRLNQTLRALSNSSQAMLRASSETDYLEEACRIIVEDCGHAMVWIGYAENDEAKTVRPVAQAGFEDGYVETLNLTWADTMRGTGPTGTAIRTGQPSRCRNMLTDPSFAPWREQAINRGYASSLVLPLLSDGKAFGALSIYDREADAFSEHAARLLSELAGDLAYGISAIRLRESRAKSEQSLRQSLQRVELLAKTTEELLRSRQPRTAVQLLCQRAMKHLDCHAFLNFLLDPHAGRLHLNACAGISAEEAKRIEWLDDGVTAGGSAVCDGCRMVTDAISTSGPCAELFKSDGIKAYACHPLLGLEGEVLGTLSFGTRSRESFSDADVSLMKAVADQIASAMVRMRAEEEMIAARRSAEQAKAAAEQANLAKNQFLAVLSHELRTPLSPVLATVTMLQGDLRELQSGAGENGQRQFDADLSQGLELIHRNVEMEARLIDDLLDVARIERGKVELQKQPLELATIIRHALEVCRADIESHKLKITTDLEEGACLVNADGARLQQVFWNLIKNATKFTPEGGRLGVRCWRESPEQVVIIVNDNGVGIDAEALPQIFNAFEQAGRQITRQFGGLGLGLTISKAMVELHGGTIVAQSEGKGKGATFTVRLPVALVPLPAALPLAPTCAGAAPVRSRKPEGIRALRILMVEDHGDTAQIMRRLLLRSGHEVVAAADLATALKLSGEGTFDLLLSDLGLPDGSGLDLMRTLRRRGMTLPGIALSGYGQESDVQASREAGFHAHLVKPVKLAMLEDAIAKAVAAAGADRWENKPDDIAQSANGHRGRE